MCETGALALPKCVIHYEHTHNETEPKIIRETQSHATSIFKVHVITTNEREVTLAWGKEQVAQKKLPRENGF